MASCQHKPLRALAASKQTQLRSPSAEQGKSAKARQPRDGRGELQGPLATALSVPEDEGSWTHPPPKLPAGFNHTKE